MDTLTPDQCKFATDQVNAQAKSLLIGACALVARLKIAGLPPHTAVDVCVQALFTAAAGLVSTAQHAGDVRGISNEALIEGLRRILGLPDVIYERQPDGSFGPHQPIN
jgi:hypothetical protein